MEPTQGTQKKKVVDYWAPDAWQQAGLPRRGPLPKGAIPTYIRFGDPPPGGKSYNYRDHYYEDGVTVFKGYKLKLPDGSWSYAVDFQEQIPLASIFVRTRHRPAYEVVGGTPCGTGSGL